VRLEGLGKLKKKIHLIGTRNRDLPACSIVPQPTTLPRASATNFYLHFSKRNKSETIYFLARLSQRYCECADLAAITIKQVEWAVEKCCIH
jgi:hypothetical protein